MTPQQPPPPSPGLPSVIDGPLAIVGDLHGGADLLERLLAQLRETPGFQDRWLVFVGDFLDRGPQPRQCLEAVLALREQHGRLTACMGNHDMAICGALGLVLTPPSACWRLRYLSDYDAYTTFASYGVGIGREDFLKLAADVRRIRPYFNPADPLYSAGEVPPPHRAFRDETLARGDALLDELRRRMPQAHRDFLAGLPWCIEHPQVLVVHAGLLPGRPFAEQLAILRARDFQDTRPPWLHDHGLADLPGVPDCTRVLVSGHFTVSEVKVRWGGRRVLVDTYGGCNTFLSALLVPEMRVVTSKEPRWPRVKAVLARIAGAFLSASRGDGVGRSRIACFGASAERKRAATGTCRSPTEALRTLKGNRPRETTSRRGEG